MGNTDSLGIGTLVRDTRTGRIGKVMDVVAGSYALRPQGGGKEWHAAPEDVIPMKVSEAMSGPVSAANALSTRGRR